VAEITRAEHAQQLIFFHVERGDMSKYYAFDEAIKLFPEVQMRYRDHQFTESMLNNVVDSELAREAYVEE
jgi:hypothetical protein